MAGPAFTIRTAAGDNGVIHQAFLELFRPGDVLVVDGGGDTSRALIGEIIAQIAEHRGAAGFVIDGAILAMRAHSPAPQLPRVRPGGHSSRSVQERARRTNVPVSIGGMVVHPGSIVVGDEDGVVAFPQSRAADLLVAVREQEAKEEAILKSVRDGTYKGAYAT